MGMEPTAWCIFMAEISLGTLRGTIVHKQIKEKETSRGEEKKKKKKKCPLGPCYKITDPDRFKTLVCIETHAGVRAGKYSNKFRSERLRVDNECPLYRTLNP